jgi:hypothetical protein
VQAWRLAGPALSAELAAARPRGEPVARDAVVVPQREAVAWDAAEEPRQEAAAWVEAAVPRQVAAAVRQREGRGAAEVLLQVAAPDVRVVQRWAALPSAVLWAFLRDQVRRPARPAPQPAARFARAMERLRIASP